MLGKEHQKHLQIRAAQGILIAKAENANRASLQWQNAI